MLLSLAPAVSKAATQGAAILVLQSKGKADHETSPHLFCASRNAKTEQVLPEDRHDIAGVENVFLIAFGNEP